jgi:hypothetical protein
VTLEVQISFETEEMAAAAAAHAEIQVRDTGWS